MGKPAPEVCAKIAARLDPLFPNADPLVNRELVSLLVYLDSRTIVAKTVPHARHRQGRRHHHRQRRRARPQRRYANAVAGMHGSRPNRQAIAYAYALREARAGWTPELRKTFFGWFPRTAKWSGGNSFRSFLNNIRNEALANCVHRRQPNAPPSRPSPRPAAAGPAGQPGHARKAPAKTTPSTRSSPSPRPA